MTRITRRRFIKGSVATTVGLATAPMAPLESALAASKPPDIVDVSGSDPAAMVKAALDAIGGIAKVVSKGDFVVLKPNAGFANPEAWATTTHPETVVAVAKACLQAGAKLVTVLEFPLGRGKKCLDRCGLTKALEQVPLVKVKVLGESKDFRKVKIKGGVALKETEVAKGLLSADCYINIPAAKAHSATGVSMGLKNAMGLIYNRRVLHTDVDLHQGVADLGRVIQPQLTIVDATRVLLTNGPAGPGETSKLGRMVAGFNVVSTDAYALTLARFNQRQMGPADARHILLAAEAGLGEAEVSKLTVKKVTA